MNRPIPSAHPAPRKPFNTQLYAQVLAAIALGVAIGHFYPELGESLKPLGDAFIKLVKMIIAPVIFLTITTGIAGMNDLQKVDRVAGTARVGAVYGCNGFSIFSLLRHVKEELLPVPGTSSSQAAMPSLVEMEKASARRSVVGLAIPAGHPFNLGGINIYLTLAALCLAQATNTNLSIGDRILLLLVAMVPAKGATRTTSAGFVTLSATLFVVPTAPGIGMVLIIGVDHFLSECRALTNFLGNTVVTLGVDRWGKAG